VSRITFSIKDVGLRFSFPFDHYHLTYEFDILYKSRLYFTYVNLEIIDIFREAKEYDNDARERKREY